MKDRIIEIIKRHRSYLKAITSAQIRNQLRGITDVDLRTYVADAVINDHELIGSCDSGFYYIVTKEDLDIAKGYILSRIEPMRKRVTSLDFNWYTASQIQPELPI